jgi:hypothetical protein
LATPDSRFAAQRPLGMRKGSIKGCRLRGAC